MEETMSNPLKKTMVYLGLADDDLEYEEQQHAAPAAPAAAPAPVRAEKSAPVTPLRKPTAVRQQTPAPSELNEILTVHPKQYRDAQIIAESFRDGVPVIINLSQMSDGDARRLIDFASGLSQGLYGKIERVTSKVFLLSPEHVAVSGDNGNGAPEAAEATFFAQS
jgi:cell division inhibitor SepF